MKHESKLHGNSSQSESSLGLLTLYASIDPLTKPILIVDFSLNNNEYNEETFIGYVIVFYFDTSCLKSFHTSSNIKIKRLFSVNVCINNPFSFLINKPWLF